MYHKQKIKKGQLPFFVYFSICFLFVLFSANFAKAGVVVTPAIIDEKAEARDVLEFSLLVNNDGSSLVRLYAIVNDISEETGKQEFLDPTLMPTNTSLARWIRVTRGMIELEAGEEREIPLYVEVPPAVEPGKYHAAVVFGEGLTREEAEKRASVLNQPQLIVNLEVQEKIIENAQIKIFQTEKNLFFQLPVKFLLEVENIGNKSIQPTGSIYIYNRKGEEVGDIPINKAMASVSPLAVQSFEQDWAAEQGFGKYKARLVAEYGNQSGSLQDTVYFWVLPGGFLTMFGGGFLTLVLIMTSMILSRRKVKDLTSKPRKKSVSAVDIRSTR